MIGNMKAIRVERWVIGKDAEGNNEESKAESHSFWAEITRKGGSRVDTASRATISDVMEFRINYRTDWEISGNWMLVYFGKRYKINSIERINEKQFNWLIIANGKN